MSGGGARGSVPTPDKDLPAGRLPLRWGQPDTPKVDRVLDMIIGGACTVACLIVVTGTWIDNWWFLHKAEHPGLKRDLVRRILDRQIAKGDRRR